MKNQKIKYTLVGLVCVAVLGVISYFYWFQGTNTSEQDQNQKQPDIVNKSNGTNGQGSEGNSTEDVNNLFPLDMSEFTLQDVIHQMSHQKVKADRKWGAIQITPERISRLIEVVEQNNYAHKTTYLDILYGWKEGDFSEADKDHNAIWELQGGTVGKAKGILSKAEEQKFIKKHFK